MLYKRLVQLTICLHWFNPLVWLMGREISRACELACDEAVIRELDEAGRLAYGDTLVRTMEAGGKYGNSLASATLTENAELLKERLKSIMAYKKTSKLAALPVLLLAAVLLMGAAAGAYTGPERLEPSKTADSAEARYTQEGYYQAPYMFEIGWNISDRTGEKYARTRLSLPGGGTLDVYYTSECKDAMGEQKVRSALAVLLKRLQDEAADTAFSLKRPLLVGFDNVGDSSPAALAERYYDEGSLPQFGAAFALLGEREQQAWIETIYEDQNVSFFGMAVSQLEEDSPLIEKLAEKVYEDGAAML